MIPDIPHPNSRIEEFASREPFLNSRLPEELIQEANKGVIFQTTIELASDLLDTFQGTYLPLLCRLLGLTIELLVIDESETLDYSR